MDEQDAPEWAEQAEADLKRIKECADRLREYFDTVQILCGRFEPDAGEGRTVTWNHGRGDFYSRLGQVRRWLIIEEEALRRQEHSDPRDPP